MNFTLGTYIIRSTPTGWIIHRSGARRISTKMPTRRGAERVASDLSKRRGNGCVVILNHHGEIIDSF